ncbi:MAG TPA: dTMP kinase, partial [Anaerolineae bacterium]
IKPHLARGGIVVCDRFADSTLAYQGYGRGLDLQTLRQLLTFATYGLKPDLTLLLDMDVDLGLQRKAGDEEWNRLDAETVDFHRRVRSGYLALASAEPERYQIIQADLPLEQVAGQVQSTVSHALERQSHGL